jgi:hypothetical protein
VRPIYRTGVPIPSKCCILYIFSTNISIEYFNPLNADLNPTCHLLVLLGKLNFYGSVHCKYIPIYVYIQQDLTLHSLYLETALHVSGGTSTHHQERIQLYLQHLVFVTPLLRSAAIVEELEPVWVCCGWLTPHVEQFPDINKLRNVASCWIYSGIVLGAHPILRIGRIRVKHAAHSPFFSSKYRLFHNVTFFFFFIIHI